MKVDGTRTFDAPRDVVWRVLNSPESMAKLMPGVESFEIQDERHWRANVKIPLGLGGLKMSIQFEQAEVREPEFSRLHAKGNGVGAIMNMETQFHLSETATGTDMRWEADVNIAGPVGSMGQRVLQPIINQQVANVLNALEKQVQEAKGPPDTGSAGAPAPSLDAVAETDPTLRDAGPPAESSPDPDPASVEGTSGAEDGINPWSPEPYTPDPQGPTTSTEDRG